MQIRSLQLEVCTYPVRSHGTDVSGELQSRCNRKSDSKMWDQWNRDLQLQLLILIMSVGSKSSHSGKLQLHVNSAGESEWVTAVLYWIWHIQKAIKIVEKVCLTHLTSLAQKEQQRGQNKCVVLCTYNDWLTAYISLSIAWKQFILVKQSFHFPQEKKIQKSR